MLKNDLMLSEDYKDWVESISSRYRQCQIKAAVSVNRELIQFYWSLGKDIVEREAEKQYGSGFYTSLSKDFIEGTEESEALYQTKVTCSSKRQNRTQ